LLLALDFDDYLLMPRLEIIDADRFGRSKSARGTEIPEFIGRNEN
jgi:hypothetical protein